jgi:hypothetical protein
MSKNDANGVKTFTKYTNNQMLSLKETITSNSDENEDIVF